MNREIFTQNGRFLMLALDHLGSFRRLVNPGKPDAVSQEEIVSLKSRIIAPLVDQFSGILLDFEYGLPAYQQVIAEKKVNHPPPFLLRIEETGYEGDGSARYSRVKYSAHELKNAGAAGVKLLLYFNPFSESADAQIEMGRKVLDDAHRANLPLFLEVVTYKENKERFLDAQSAAATRVSKLVLESVGMFLERNVVPDVWKLEYPGDAKSCQRLTAIVGDTPWILLTRGAKFAEFKDNLEVAVENGCAGFLAGRALWQESVRETFPYDALPVRFRALSRIVLRPR